MLVERDSGFNISTELFIGPSTNVQPIGFSLFAVNVVSNEQKIVDCGDIIGFSGGKLTVILLLNPQP